MFENKNMRKICEKRMLKKCLRTRRREKYIEKIDEENI
jgi:hypothetical protein